ncbi:amidase [Corynebacterium crudilactis]|uniref:Indole acetimide hydrolase n=1 Tax=Corynebacterium crudilactis TaxID=1652495 RepID=A0A172QWB7_9CORY|nr:amidase [Corynebacterium crudilactis]ANE05002.1 indole acetimide hydrolase [Corynebacterium crudilactis]
MTSTFRNKSISEQVHAIQTGTISSAELAAVVRTDIIRYEKNLHAWVELSELEDIKPDNNLRPLEGISIGIKDIIDVAGLPTRCGSSITPSSPASTDADCVARVRELGAIIQGKTVTTEFGYFSPGPTKNPWRHSLTPGGSSSGSAAAVGANTIQVALGTQTAGSLTRPASFCGAAGMILPPGSTSMLGVHGLSHTLDSLGFLTRSTADLDTFYSAFVGIEPDTDPKTESLEIRIWDGSDILPLSPQMHGLLSELPPLINKLGISYAPLEWSDHIQTLTEDHRTVMGYEAAKTMAQAFTEHKEQLSPQLQELLSNGATINEQDYREALIRTKSSRLSLERLLGVNGVIIGPAAASPAPEYTSGTGSPDLSRAWQLLGLPVVIVPGAKTTTGLPLGLQIIGLPGTEKKLLNLSRRLEFLLRRFHSLSEAFTSPTLKDLTW